MLEQRCLVLTLNAEGPQRYSALTRVGGQHGVDERVVMDLRKAFAGYHVLDVQQVKHGVISIRGWLRFRPERGKERPCKPLLHSWIDKALYVEEIPVQRCRRIAADVVDVESAAGVGVQEIAGAEYPVFRVVLLE